MSGLTSQQRKLVYLAGILLLLIPIIYFGLPSAGSGAQVRSGGALAQLRQKYDLGEVDLGAVDPSSVTMNLVLLGLRGVAVNQLWIQMDMAKNEKDWSRMKSITESIVRLQPHYERVWDFNGWNLAWNTSAEWDAVPDRYYWVKEGGKFLIRGVKRNEKSTDLRFRVATLYQKKIGIADESSYFRRYFLSDPDVEQFQGGPDPGFNPNGLDNYQVAGDWYQKAVDNEVTWNVPQHVVDRPIFHSMPARCLFDYAQGLQKDGKFGEITRVAWADALDAWVNRFGNEEFVAEFGGKPVRFKLEATNEDLASLGGSVEMIPLVRQAVDSYQKMVNYRYWRTRGQSEAETETADAHRNLFEAGEYFKKQDLQEALPLLEKTLAQFEHVLNRFPTLQDSDEMIEECLLAIKMWSDIYRLQGDSLPQDFPLKQIWQQHQWRMPTVEKEFRRRFLTTAN
ncbi:MAG: hypothetical protein U0872_15765 [Planctomycetaceae bacterium]